MAALNATAARLLNAYVFFREHSGGVAGRNAEHAWRHARAEEMGIARGLVFVTQDEEEPWDGECAAPEYVLWCAVFRADDVGRDGHPYRGHAGSWLASVGMVGVDTMRDPHLRCVAAELMGEALDVLDKEDAQEASEMAERATYAAGGG